jgi:hypothetical protein
MTGPLTGRARTRAAAEVVLVLFLASPLLCRNWATLCLFRRATGRNCPFCGLTRSFAALRRGRLGASFAHHPIGPLAVAAACAYLVSHPVPPVPKRTEV